MRSRSVCRGREIIWRIIQNSTLQRPANFKLIEGKKVVLCITISFFHAASPVQVVFLHVVVLENLEQLDVLADEAGRQKAMDPQLKTFLQGERHALQTYTQPNSITFHCYALTVCCVFPAEFVSEQVTFRTGGCKSATKS